MKRLFLIDAFALIYRYYYAFIARPMRNSKGMNTSIVYGVTKFIREIIATQKPDMIGVAFDPHGGTFRNRICTEYKANRPATPEDIIASEPYIKEIIKAMNIPILEVPDFEADDVIGTLAHKASEKGYEVFMVTPDKDYGQIVDDNCKIYRQAKGDTIEIVDKAKLKEKYDIDNPRLVADILAIWGDSVDNIKGVYGIGEKGASRLVAKYGDIENIIAAADSIGGRTGEAIKNSIADLRRAKTLTTIRFDVPIELDEDMLKLSQPDNAKLKEIFTQLEFRSLTAALDSRNSSTTSNLSNDSTNKPIQSSAEIAQQLPLLDIQPTTEPSKKFVPHPQNYKKIESSAQLSKVIKQLEKAAVVTFECVTSGTDTFRDKITNIAICADNEAVWYIPFNENSASLLRPIFENANISKACHNIKQAILALRNASISVKGYKYDTMLLHYLLNPESAHSLSFIAYAIMGYDIAEKAKPKVGEQLSLLMETPDNSAEVMERVEIVAQLYPILVKALKKENQMPLYDNIEQPLIDVLADMEYTGVTIDKTALKKYSVLLKTQLATLETEIRTTTETPNLNINSSKQLGEVLFNKLKITDKPKKTASKQYCTDEEYLQSFATEVPVVAKILEYRGLKKLISTYVDALPLLINPVTGRIHTSYNQAVTSTGRLSSTNPNLQNIPVREKIGQPIRAAFIPSSPDRLLLSADYSQVELRLMAHLSGDKELCHAFCEGKDIHAATAAKIYKEDIEQVSAEQRRRAKTANFGIIYGISAFGLSSRLKISRTEAKQLIDGYFQTYPAVREYMERAIEKAREKGYVTTEFGRRRYLPDIKSRNANIRALAERNAINAPIQGSAADIMKKAMIGVWQVMRYENLKSKMIMQVHDEIIIDLVPNEQERVKQIIIEQMEGAAKLSIPLTADCGIGKNWLEAH